MSPQLNAPGSVQLTIQTYGSTDGIPKHIELFNQSLKRLQSQWISGNEWQLSGIDPGTYVLRLSLTSGVQTEEVVDVQTGDTTAVRMDLAGISPYETQEWAYMAKSNTGSRLRYMKELVPGPTPTPSLMACTYRILQFSNGFWIPSEVPGGTLQIDSHGETFEVTLGERMYVLELSGEQIPTLYVGLPPHSRLKCLVKPTTGPQGAVHPLDIAVSTDNWASEALIALLTAGAMEEAATLTNAEKAERLLFEKNEDPAAAAVGGYFLLKMGELGRMHNWANNLANRFPYLPDGAVIHAWQLLQEKQNTIQHIKTISDRLVEALRRGIPVYTEGFRLLYRGLKMVSSHYGGQNLLVNTALDIASRYAAVLDWSQETTTLITDALQTHDRIIPVLARGGTGNNQDSFPTNMEAIAAG